MAYILGVNVNDIDKMPPKCKDCPYWEIAEKPYLCSNCKQGDWDLDGTEKECPYCHAIMDKGKKKSVK